MKHIISTTTLDIAASRKTLSYASSCRYTVIYNITYLQLTITYGTNDISNNINNDKNNNDNNKTNETNDTNDTNDTSNSITNTKNTKIL